ISSKNSSWHSLAWARKVRVFGSSDSIKQNIILIINLSGKSYFILRVWKWVIFLALGNIQENRGS
ncbi:hypothetical protein LWT69_23185, partial [Enterobacter hormaechei]|nr:hypothetical protein [Enterobacter hormaechei]